MTTRSKTPRTQNRSVAVRDGLTNVVNALGTHKDPRTSTTYTFTPTTPEQLLTAYRSNWLARRIVDCFAEDATREWRDWQASEDQIQLIEDAEKALGLQKKTRQAIIRARLYGGSALVMGIANAGNLNEELDLERVGRGALKFVLVLSSYEMSRGQLIVDATSPWFGRPEWYRINTGRANLGDLNASLTDIHPSRVIEFVGSEIPSWDVLNGSNTWGDSVLQSVDDVLKDYGLSLASIAALISDAKVDVYTIPGLTKKISNPVYESALTRRLVVSNQFKSILNAMVMDENEKHERIQTQFSGLPQILSELLKVVAGAAGIPLTRLVGHGSGSGKSTLGNGTSGGESDLRNYYDAVTAQQRNDYGPALAPLDEVVERSALGTYDESVYYDWRPLYTPDPMEQAQIQLAKAQSFTSDVTNGLINPDVLRAIRINQLVEDGVYPGIQDAIDEFGAEPEEPVVTPEDVQSHLAMLQKSSQQLQQIGSAAALPAPSKPAETATANDGHALSSMRMFQ